jgi:RNA polymerase sigma factor (sigma-70 family)
MSTAQAALLRHIHQLAGTGNADPLGDRELLRRFAAGRDEAAFAALVRRHGPMVLSVCRRTLHRPQDVEDAFQATFLVLLRKAAGHPWRESIGGWLHGVAVRVALRVRAEAVRGSADARRAEEHTNADPLEQLTARELFAVFDEGLARLPATYREPLVLCYLEGKTREEAARQLGWSLSTLRRRLEGGRKRLHLRLSRRGLALPAALGAVLLSGSASSASFPMPAVNGAAPARATTLADAVGKAALLAPIKTISALLVALSVLAAGAGLAVQHISAEPPQAPPAEQSPRAEAKPKDETAPRTDLYGDPLPPGALLRLGTVRFRHQNLIGSVAYSPDGKILAAGGYHGVIFLYDAATGRKLRELQAYASQFPPIAFSPDGKTLASAGGKTIQLWDVDTGQELRQFSARVSNEHYHRFTTPLVFSPDGKALASVSALDHCVRVWDAKTGKELVKLQGHQDPVRCLAFSPDGKTLFSAGGDVVTAGSVRVWSVATGKELRKITLHHPRAVGQPDPLCFSPDGKTFVFAAHDSLPPKKRGQAFINVCIVTFLDLQTGEVRRKLEPQEGRLKSAAFSPDGKTLATMNGVPTVTGTVASDDGNRIQIWDTATGKQLFDFPAYVENLHQGPTCLTFAPDGKKLAASASASSLHVWEVPTVITHPARDRTVFGGPPE